VDSTPLTTVSRIAAEVVGCEEEAKTHEEA
jgi:hypothetical protein